MAAVATRVIARTFEYEISPFRIEAEIRGSPASALATRTFSRAAPRSSPVRQLSQCAHERQAPSFQPLRSSNSRIITRS